MIKVKALVDIQYRDKTFEKGSTLEVDDRLAKSWSANGIAEALERVAEPVAELEAAAGELEGEVAAELPKPKKRGKGK